jgi:hypothetical protein
MAYAANGARKMTLTTWERIWYVLMRIVFGVAYLAKVPVKKALQDFGLIEMTNAERFWYALMCVPLGAGYFAKVPVAKALSELPQYQAGVAFAPPLPLSRSEAEALNPGPQRWDGPLARLGWFVPELPLSRPNGDVRNPDPKRQGSQTWRGVAAGWYVDAMGSGGLRWWDGSQWTEHVYATGPPRGS